MKMIDWSAFGAALTQDRSGGAIDTDIPATDIDHYARLFLPLGGEAEIESPPELIDVLCRTARAVHARYH